MYTSLKRAGFGTSYTGIVRTKVQFSREGGKEDEGSLSDLRSKFLIDFFTREEQTRDVTNLCQVSFTRIYSAE